MIKLYECLFYKLYRWSEIVNGKTGSHAYMAVMMISSLCIVNTFSALILLSFGSRELFIPKSYGLAVAVLWIIANATYFFKENRYKEIIKRSPAVCGGKTASVMVAIFVLFSFLLLLSSGYYLMSTIKGDGG